MRARCMLVRVLATIVQALVRLEQQLERVLVKLLLLLLLEQRRLSPRPTALARLRRC